MGPTGTKEMAGPAVYLASHASDFVTARETISVDGGYFDQLNANHSGMLADKSD